MGLISFQKMNDAAEVLEILFKCLHECFAAPLSEADICTDASCIAHSIFGMYTHETVRCHNCVAESKVQEYPSFVRYITGSHLRTLKAKNPQDSFDMLLYRIKLSQKKPCDRCRTSNNIDVTLFAPPHLFIAVLVWQNSSEKAEDISATLAALSNEVRLGILCRGLDPEGRHLLVSVVCYYSQHYICFRHSHEERQWILYDDDKHIEIIGSWDEVVATCVDRCFQPQILMYESVVDDGVRNENNYSLNPIVQSLWHIRRFREEFLLRSYSPQTEEHCDVVSALHEIFTALDEEASDKKKAVDHTSLRLALGKAFGNANFFQVYVVNQVIEKILDCLHCYFAAPSKNNKDDTSGSCICTDASCIAHSFFGMDILETLICLKCKTKNSEQKYTSFVHHLDSDIEQIKNSSDTLSRMPTFKGNTRCRYCGYSKNQYVSFLSAPPHGFIAAVRYLKISEIEATLAAISSEIQLSSCYRGIDPENRHRLVSVIAYDDKSHTMCFCRSHGKGSAWMMHDDENVKEIGSWDEVVATCVKGCIRPQMLMYEAVIE